MPTLFKICCVPGCYEESGSAVLHTFPCPKKDPNRFRDWLYAVGGDILKYDSAYISKSRRVCHKHFETKYSARNKRLTVDAVPTLYLAGFRDNKSVNAEGDVTQDDAGNPVHIFPNPDKDLDCFKTWVDRIGETLNTPEDYQRLRFKRLCSRHFLEKYRNRFNRLNVLAVPSLHLCKRSPISDPLAFEVPDHNDDNNFAQDKTQGSSQSDGIDESTVTEHSFVNSTPDKTENSLSDAVAMTRYVSVDHPYSATSYERMKAGMFSQHITSLVRTAPQITEKVLTDEEIPQYSIQKNPSGAKTYPGRKKHCVSCRVSSTDVKQMANFPSDPVRCKKWVETLGIKQLELKPVGELTKNTYVCYRHFSENQLIWVNDEQTLTEDAVPNMNGNIDPLEESRDYNYCDPKSQIIRPRHQCVHCKSWSDDGPQGVKMTTLPSDPVRCMKWVEALGLKELASKSIEELSTRTYLCFKHFTAKELTRIGGELKVTLKDGVPQIDVVSNMVEYNFHSFDGKFQMVEDTAVHDGFDYCDSNDVYEDEPPKVENKKVEKLEKKNNDFNKHITLKNILQIPNIHLRQTNTPTKFVQIPDIHLEQINKPKTLVQIPKKHLKPTITPKKLVQIPKIHLKQNIKPKKIVQIPNIHLKQNNEQKTIVQNPNIYLKQTNEPKKFVQIPNMYSKQHNDPKKFVQIPNMYLKQTNKQKINKPSNRKTRAIVEKPFLCKEDETQTYKSKTYDEFLLIQLTDAIQRTVFCSLCLKTDESCLSTLDATNHYAFWREESELSYLQILVQVFGSDVEVSLPSRYICEECSKSAVEAFSFIHKTKTTQQVLNQYIKDIECTLDSVDNTCKEYMEEPIKEVAILPQTDRVIQKVKKKYPTKKERLEFKKSIMESYRIKDNKYFICPDCGELKRSILTMKTHLRLHNDVYKTLKCASCRLAHFKGTRCKYTCYECNKAHCIHDKYIVELITQRENGAECIKCPDCDFTTKKRRTLLAHANKEHLNNYSLICEGCSQRFYSRQLLTNHVNKFHARKHTCEYCNRPFKLKSMKEKHERVCEKIRRQFGCTECKYSSDTKKQLSFHFIRQHTEGYKCSICNFKAINENRLRVHVTSTHSGKTLQKRCLICNDMVAKGNMPEHMMNTHHMTKARAKHWTEIGHGKKLSRCNRCQAPFTSREERDEHLKTHLVQTCPRCEIPVSESDYREHMRNHEIEDVGEVYPCANCNKKFPTLHRLKLHDPVHYAPIQCNVCNKKVKFLCFKKHSLMHKAKTDPQVMQKLIRRPRLKCPQCDKTCTTKGHLEAHVNAEHYNTKPYKCGICPREFAAKFLLNNHLEQHLGRKYECMVCRQKFARRDAYIRHSRESHGDICYECPTCGDRFTEARSLIYHRNVRHNWGAGEVSRSEEDDCAEQIETEVADAEESSVLTSEEGELSKEEIGIIDYEDVQYEVECC